MIRAITRQDIIDAAKLCIEHNMGSTSMLQKKMAINYNKARILIEILEELDIVGPDRSPKPREVVIRMDNKDHLDAALSRYVYEKI